MDKLKEVCSGGGDEFLKSKFAILMEMWEHRIGMSVSEQPENLIDKVKVDIIWKVLEIFKESCPTADPLYVYLIGRFYLMHLQQAWNTERAQGGDGGGSMNDTSDGAKATWYFTNSFFDFCIGHRTALVSWKYYGFKNLITGPF